MAVAAVFAALAVAVPAVTAAHEGDTVQVKTTLTLDGTGQRGKVKASKAACTERRAVILKQIGHGVIGSDVSNDNGGWEVPPANFGLKGHPPWKVFAEVKPTSGTLYRCLGAKSRTLEIAPPDVTDVPRPAE